MRDHASTNESMVTNGIDVSDYDEIVEAVTENPDLAKFEFRASNRWEWRGLNRTAIGGFFGAGEEQGAEGRMFLVDADEPPVLLGDDTAPNPVEYLLHALTACLTSSIVYKAAARGIEVESIESTLEGSMDARKFLELTDEGRTGYEKIKVSFRIKSDASAQELEELAKFSPVFDVVTNGTPVLLAVESV